MSVLAHVIGVFVLISPTMVFVGRSVSDRALQRGGIRAPHRWPVL
ncbi:hypothetical protein [Streptomyces albireticuli]